MAVELSRNTRKKSSGDEHGQQNEGGGHHRARHLAHGLNGGFFSTQTALHFGYGRLDHNDGIVHDDTDGQHQAEERKHVKGKAHGQHHREGSDERHRDRHGGNDGSAPILQKQKEDQKDEQNSFNERDVDLFNGCIDKQRGIVRDRVFKTFGKRSTQLFHGVAYLCCHFQRVGTGELVNGYTG